MNTVSLTMSYAMPESAAAGSDDGALVQRSIGGDLRAFDLIGWDLASVPEPACALLLSCGVLLLVRRRRS